MGFPSVNLHSLTCFPSRNATTKACLDYARYVTESNDGYDQLSLENCTSFVEQYICNLFSGLEQDCDPIRV